MRLDRGAWQDAQVSVGGNPLISNHAEFADGGLDLNSLQQRTTVISLLKMSICSRQYAFTAHVYDI